MRAAVAGRSIDCGELCVDQDCLGISSIVVRAGDDRLVLHPVSPRPRPPQHVETHLTPRQREVLGLLAEGMRVTDVARRLGIAELTVRNHVRALMLELGAHSQLGAVAEARARGILS
jgi:DNA-binding NarL/FixJ family response regulator